MPDVAQLCNTLASADGGPARHALEVNLALNAIGLRTRMIVLNDSADSMESQYASREDFPALAPITIVSRRTCWSEIVQAGKAMKKADAWILHGYYLPWIPWVVAVARFSGKRIVIMPHGALTDFDRSKNERKKRIFHAVFGRFIGKVAHFVVATDQEAIELRKFNRSKRVAVVGAGASVPLASEPLGNVHVPVRLLSLSRLATKKRIDLSILALAKYIERGGSATLTIAGSGSSDLQDQLEELAISQGVRSCVNFVGQIEGDEKIRLLDDSDLFLLLSDDENFGIGFVDAVSRGIPSIITNAVAAGASAPDGVVYRLDSGSPEMVSDAIFALLENYMSIRLATVEYASQNFSWRSVALRWESVLRSKSSV